MPHPRSSASPIPGAGRSAGRTVGPTSGGRSNPHEPDTPRSDLVVLAEFGVALIASVALVAAASLTGAASSAVGAPTTAAEFTAGFSAEDAEGWLTDIPLSSELETDVVASGTIETADGDEFAANLPVALYGWPSIDVLDSMAIGESVHLTPIAKALTDADGSFELRIDDPAAAERLATDEGLVDLQVQAWSPDSAASYSFTKQLTEDDGELVLDDPDEAGDVTAEDAAAGEVEDAAAEDAAAEDAGTEDAAAEDGGEAADLELVAEPVGDAEALPDDAEQVFEKSDVCGATKLWNATGVDVIVGRMYSSTVGIRSYFKLSQSGTATLGVATSVSGKYGGYDQSGTTTVTLDDSFTWEKSKLTTGRQFVTDFTYSKFSNWCYPVYASPSQKQVYSYTVKPTRWEGGGFTQSESVPSVKAANCRPFAGLTTQTKASTKATTNTLGVKIKSILGINLTSKSGYTGKVTAKIYNISQKKKTLCGTSGTPSSPGRFLAKD